MNEGGFNAAGTGAVWRRSPAKRGAFLLARLARVGQTGVRVRPLGGDRAGEVRISRFLRNPKVTPQEMFAAAATHTASLVKGRHILAIQDTTSLRDDGNGHSLQLHPMIAVDAHDGALLGLVHGCVLRRVGGKRGQRTERPFAEKESRRWLDATCAATTLTEAGAACVTVIADREGDIYEEFAGRPPEVELLIRAGQNRLLEDGTRLFDCAQSLPELGRIKIDIPAGPGRAARVAELAVWAKQVVILQPPRRIAATGDGTLAPKLHLHFVETREINPPAGAPPAHWRLLTTHPVTTLAEATEITGFYRARWTIEQLFRTFKTKGFNIEAVRIADETPFENLAVATLIAAIQVLQLVRDRDGTAGRRLEDVLETSDRPALEAVSASLEGRTARQKNPHPKGSLAFAAWVCARLGGWTGYYGKPGPIVMCSGLHQLKAILQGWKLSKDV